MKAYCHGVGLQGCIDEFRSVKLPESVARVIYEHCVAAAVKRVKKAKGYAHDSLRRWLDKLGQQWPVSFPTPNVVAMRALPLIAREAETGPLGGQRMKEYCQRVGLQGCIDDFRNVELPESVAKFIYARCAPAADSAAAAELEAPTQAAARPPEPPVAAGQTSNRTADDAHAATIAAEEDQALASAPGSPCGTGMASGPAEGDVCGHCLRNLANSVTVEQHCVGPRGVECTVRSCNLCFAKVQLGDGMVVARTEHHVPATSETDAALLCLVVAPEAPDELAQELAAAGEAYMALATEHKAKGDLNGSRYLVLVQTEKDVSGTYTRPHDWMPTWAVEAMWPRPVQGPVPKRCKRTVLAETYTRPMPSTKSRVPRPTMGVAAQSACLQRVQAACNAIAAAAQRVLERDTANGLLQFLLDEMARARGMGRRCDARKPRRLSLKAGESILTGPGREGAQTVHKDELAKGMIQARFMRRPRCPKWRARLRALELRAGVSGPVLRHRVRDGDASSAERTSRRDEGHLRAV